MRSKILRLALIIGFAALLVAGLRAGEIPDILFKGSIL